MNKSQDTSPEKDTTQSDLKMYFVLASITFVILIILSLFYILSLFGSLYNPMIEPNQVALLTLGTALSFLLAWSSAMFTKISVDAYTNKNSDSNTIAMVKHLQNSGLYSLIVVMVFLSLIAVIAIEMAYLFAVDMIAVDANIVKYGVLLLLAITGLKYTNSTHRTYMENIGSMRE